MVARAASGGVRYCAACLARRGSRDTRRQGCNHAAASARSLRLRVRGGRLLRRIRRGVRSAHEPRRHAGGGARRPARLAPRRSVRAGAASRRSGRLRGAARHAAGARARRTHGACAGSGRAGCGRAGGGAHRPAGARVLRRVGGARPSATRPCGPDQAGPAGRRSSVRGGSRVGRQSQPGAQLRAGAAAQPLGPALGVLAGSAERRRAGCAAAPRAGAGAARGRSAAPGARDVAAGRQAVTSKAADRRNLMILIVTDKKITDAT